jgi:hypothetical protein
LSARLELRIAFKRLEREMPARMAAASRWLRHPASRWVRVPVALLLVAGGVLSFLPVLGIWMLPLGLMLIAADLAVLRRPMARFAHWIADRLDGWRARRR